jgi:hypothetical protein
MFSYVGDQMIDCREGCAAAAAAPSMPNLHKRRFMTPRAPATPKAGTWRSKTPGSRTADTDSAVVTPASPTRCLTNLRPMLHRLTAAFGTKAKYLNNRYSDAIRRSGHGAETAQTSKVTDAVEKRLEKVAER